MEITSEWIAEQRAVCEAATPGKWTCEAWGIEADGVTIACANTSHEISWSDQNADFIAAARTALPAALDALEASMARESEKDAKIEEQDKRIKFLEDHILRITPAYKKSRDKLLDERERLIAERDAEKKRADMATSDIKELMASCPSDFHPCDWCEEYDNGNCANREFKAGVIICQPKWRGPCALQCDENGV